MIRTFWHLLRLDFFRFIFWFRHNRLAKIAVALISLVLFAGMAYTFEQIAYYYFFSLHQFEPFGQLTAGYILHSALLVSLWFTTISSFVLATNQIWNEDRDWNWLLTQPTSAGVITFWQHWRTLVPNSALLILLWLPPAIGYARIYQVLPWPMFIALLIIATVVLTGAVQTVTTSVAWSLAPHIRKHKELVIWGGGAISVILSGLLLTSILPTSLQGLLRIDIELFADAFASLPLNQTWFFTRNLLAPLTGSSLWRFFGTLTAIWIVSVGLFIWQKSVLRKVFALSKSIDTSKTLESPTAPWYTAPLFWKEVTGFFRTRSESNFFLFFTGLIVFFFFFLHRALTINSELQFQLDTLLPFSLGAILFLTTAFLLRLVFPLLAREGRSAWHTLSEPISRQSLLVSKLLFSVFLAMIIVIAVNIGWWIVPLSNVDRTWIALYSTISILVITALNALIGFWSPDWQTGEQPDQMSTSIQGFVTLGASLIVTAGSVWFWTTARETGWIFIAGGGIISIAVLLLATLGFAIKRYQVTQ